MSEDKNKDPKQKSAPAAAGAARKASDAPASKPAGAASSAPAKPAAKPNPVPGEKADARPAPAAAKRPAKEEFPPDEDEEAEEEGFSGDADDAEEDLVLDPAALGSPDTSERIILVVDEEGQRRNETVAIITQILPNAVIEVANDPEEALEMMEEGDFDTFVVNFLMPGYSSSPFVKAVANHPEHPLLIGFAADKMSDAVDPKKGLKIIPLKRLFDMDTSASSDNAEGEAAEE
jgi:CheY-like chemotaxis protein